MDHPMPQNNYMQPPPAPIPAVNPNYSMYLSVLNAQQQQYLQSLNSTPAYAVPHMGPPVQQPQPQMHSHGPTHANMHGSSPYMNNTMQHPGYSAAYPPIGMVRYSTTPDYGNRGREYDKIHHPYSNSNRFTQMNHSMSYHSGPNHTSKPY